MLLPIWFQIALCIVLFLLVIFSLVIIIKKKISITTKKGTLSIGKGEIKTETNVKSPHANCPYKKDIVILLLKNNEIIQEKYNIEHREQIKCQMDMADQKIEQIKGLFQKVYLQKLEEKNLPDIVASTSFNAYRLVLEDIRNLMLDRIRYFLKENHLEGYSDSNYHLYTENKIEFLKTELTDTFNRTYFFKENISREELYKINQAISNKVLPLIYGIFESARFIAIENQLKIKKCDEKLQELISIYL